MFLEWIFDQTEHNLDNGRNLNRAGVREAVGCRSVSQGRRQQSAYTEHAPDFVSVKYTLKSSWQENLLSNIEGEGKNFFATLLYIRNSMEIKS